MNLRDYLHVNRIKISKFAEDINYSRSYITMIANGHLYAGKKLAQIIQKHTKCQVLIEEIIKPKHVRKKIKIFLTNLERKLIC